MGAGGGPNFHAAPAAGAAATTVTAVADRNLPCPPAPLPPTPVAGQGYKNSTPTITAMGVGPPGVWVGGKRPAEGSKTVEGGRLVSTDIAGAVATAAGLTVGVVAAAVEGLARREGARAGEERGDGTGGIGNGPRLLPTGLRRRTRGNNVFYFFGCCFFSIPPYSYFCLVSWVSHTLSVSMTDCQHTIVRHSTAHSP